MTAELVLTLLGSAGFLAGSVALFQFLNTRGAVRSKGSADAITAWRQFTTGAISDVTADRDRIMRERDLLHVARAALIDLVQELLALLRRRGAPDEELDPFRDRLDEVRAM